MMGSIKVGLKKGHRGEEVGVLQEAIKRIVPGSWLKGRYKPLKVDKDFGKHTEDCLVILQQKAMDMQYNMDIPKETVEAWKLDEWKPTGEVDEVTKWILENSHKFIEHYDLSDELESVVESKTWGNKLKEKLVMLICEQVGVKEEGANNRGKEIDEYVEYGSWGTLRKEVAPAWCQLVLAFIIRVLWNAFGYDEKKWVWLKDGIGYTPYNCIKAKQTKGMYYDIKKKEDINLLDWLYIYYPKLGRVGHVVTPIAWDEENPDLLICAEGNTNISGSRSGDSFMLRKRHWTSFACGVRILMLFGDISKYDKKEKKEEKQTGGEQTNAEKGLKQPNRMNVEELKKELTDAKITFEDNAVKKDLVKLVTEAREKAKEGNQ